MPRYTSLIFIAAIACIATLTRGEETATGADERILGFSAPAAPAGNSTASSAASVTTTAAAVAMAATGVAMIF